MDYEEGFAGEGEEGGGLKGEATGEEKTPAEACATGTDLRSAATKLTKKRVNTGKRRDNASLLFFCVCAQKT